MVIPVIQTIDLQSLASGDRLYLQIYKFTGKKAEKKVYIQANLHGAEIAGNAVIYQLIEFLTGLDNDQIEGEIWLVPVCNPVGVNQRNHFFATGRFNPYDGQDWNRIFWDYEKEKIDLETFAQSQIYLSPQEIRKNYLQELQKYFNNKIEATKTQRSIAYSQQYRYLLQSLCLDANYVIDLHSGTIKAIDYLYCFQSRQESAKYFLYDHAILLNEYDGDAFDEAFIKPWLALEAQLAQWGRKLKFEVESWTLELGSGLKMNPHSVTKGLAGIKNYLIYKNVLNLSLPGEQKDLKFIPKSDLKSYYAPRGGMIQKRVDLGSKVEVGDRLYEILSFNKSGKIPTIIEVSSEDRGLVFDVSTNEAVNQGEYVLGIFPHV
jgi:predicted deacylase